MRTFKEAMKAGCRDGLSLSHRLQSFLLTYRSTPHATTGRSPCELFLGRKVRTRLDLLHPSVEETVLQRQAQQKKDHDWHSKHREFAVGEKVMVKSRRPGPAGWIPGRITEKNGPLTYVVDVGGLKACMENVASKAIPESGTDFEYTTATDDEERFLDDSDSSEDLAESESESEQSNNESTSSSEESLSNSELDTHVSTPATGPTHCVTVKSTGGLNCNLTMFVWLSSTICVWSGVVYYCFIYSSQNQSHALHDTSHCFSLHF